ncbi:FecR domain-containing protein [Edaphobacter paludis]|uniref:FecR domain-containing protein n=1 Tax=Edaphobacter paludis TaxID=3035702 RepID=A0AAU7D334_9BACT
MRDGAWVQRRYMGWAVVALLCLLFAGWTREARAQDRSNAPGRAARLSFLQGNVTIDHVDNTGSDPAQINMPLAQGVRVTTGQDGQAEIEFEDGSLVRLTPNSSLDLTALTADSNSNLTTDLTLDHGLIYAELRAAAKFVYSVNAVGAQVSPVVNATVRIVMDQPPVVVSVLDGTAQVSSGDSTDGEGYRTNVNAGETLTGDPADTGRYSLQKEIAENSWDKWNTDRDAAALNEAANQTAARNDYAGGAGYGWSDLDANGSWYDVPGEGEVWQPSVAMYPGFDPYGYGSWVWYPGRGYVWASAYAWGWTPYRCGNWSYWDDFGWGWLPGSNCGFIGWGFGDGYLINIVRPPRGYRFRPIPVHSTGGTHPIRVGHPLAIPAQVHPMHQGPRTIAGRTVEPLRPVQGATALRGASPLGASLRRDFPVDRASRRPELGNGASPQHGVPARAARPGVMRPARPMDFRDGTGGREAPVRPQPSTEQRQVHPQQETRPPAPQQQQPRYSQPSQPHYSPPPQPHYSSPPPASHSTESQPAASHK